MADVEGQRRLVESATLKLDAGGFAAERVSPIGADHKARGQRFSVGGTDCNQRLVRVDRIRLILEPRQMIGKLSGALLQRCYQQTVLDVVAKYVETDFVAGKPHLGGTDQAAGIIDQAHRPQWRRPVFAAPPNVQLLQQIDGTAKQRGGAIVGVGRSAGDEGGIGAGLRQRNRGRKSCRAAADHDDVVCTRYFVHTGTIDVPGSIFKPTSWHQLPDLVTRRNVAIADVQIEAIPDSTAGQMNQANQKDSLLTSPATRAAAFSVHIFTALGAGIALIALLEAVREHWAAMFGWLGAALVMDALDGPIARRLDVARLQPNWSGDVLDLVVDFVTYVFVPAYAITASGLLLPVAAPLLGAGIVVTGALYFADRRMKADDNHFRGFPALWNAAAFYLFLLHLPPAISSLAVAILLVLTFVPFRVVHPVRVVRLRNLTLSLLAIWAVLAVITLAFDFNVDAPITIGLCAIAVYIIGSDAAIRFVRSLRA